MIRTSPFHQRTSALNETGLWSHWAGRLAVEKYQLSEKAEYVSVRNAAGITDVSPLFKYRFSGPGAETFLGSVLARDPRVLAPGDAHYTLWCDDRGFLVEDGVLLRHAVDDFVLTAAEPNLAYFADLVRPRDRVTIEDVSDAWAVLALQGPRSRMLLERLDKGIGKLAFFGHGKAKIGGHTVSVSRTGFTGDLGYEIWCRAEDALDTWDAAWEATRGYGVVPFGLQALYMTRIEAGLLLLDVDFSNSRFAWTDADRATPVELGLGWMLRGIEADDRRFPGRAAILGEITGRTSRFRTTGIVVDYKDWNRRHDEAGLVPPMDHAPVQEEQYLYDDEGTQIGRATSFMYSPVLQRHIGIARVPVASAIPGSKVNLEIPINHRYVHVAAATARLPHYNPQRKTA
ncbi:MAG: aminomethyltransferase family protein [Chloroflexota bacterium]